MHGCVRRLSLTVWSGAMQGLWDGFEGRGFAAWLPSFYDAVLNAASSEARWCATALPDSHPGLLLQLLNALFSRLDKPFRTRLASALVQGGPLSSAIVYLLYDRGPNHRSNGARFDMSAGLFSRDIEVERAS